MIPLAVPNLSGKEREYLNKCIDTTFVSSVGEYVTGLEKTVAQATGSARGVATSAGTTGLHAALTAVGVEHGDLVIIPDFTFIATANAVAHCGALPWCMDVSEDDWCLDPAVLQRELESKTERRDGKLVHIETGRRVAALMPVYTLGNIPDMKRIKSIAESFSLPVIVDAACAIGAKYASTDDTGLVEFGGLADASVISFNGNKTVTCGGGGMVVGDDEELLERIHHLTTTARLGSEYDFDMVGFNYRMTNLQAAVGCAQMERLDEFVTRKRQVHDFYARAFDDITYGGNLGDDRVRPFPMTEGGTCWFSGVLLPEDRTIEDVRDIASKLREADIEGRTFWKPIHLQEMYRVCPRSDLPVSESIWGRIVTLPCSTGITDEELERVVEVVRGIVGG